jgi:hypothetical protein
MGDLALLFKVPVVIADGWQGASRVRFAVANWEEG